MLTLSEKLAATQENVEKNCESERREAYLKNALYYGEDVISLTATVKAKLKDDAIRELNAREKRISRAWQKLESYWRMHIIECYELIISEFVILFAMLCIHHKYADKVTLISAISVSILIIVTFYILYFRDNNTLVKMSRARSLIEELLSNYSDYGRIEATLYFVDYDTHPPKNKVRWIHTPTHIEEFDSIEAVVKERSL